MYMPAAYGTPWQYCSYSRFNTPLLIITFCFHTAWVDSRRLGKIHLLTRGTPD